jgi:plasmid stability protein
LAQNLEGTEGRNQNGSSLQMPLMHTTLTLKNIPDEVYERLKRSADLHRRSMKSEAIVCLEAALLPARIEPIERLASARALQAMLKPAVFQPDEIDAFKREARE